MFKQIKNELKTENCFYFYCLILNFVHNRFDLKNHTRSQDSKKTSCMFWQKFLWSVELTRFYNTYLSWLQRDAQFIKLSYHITNRILAVGYIIYYLFAQQKSLLLALVVASFIDFLKKKWNLGYFGGFCYWYICKYAKMLFFSMGIIIY